jgi:hypothetical protein
MTQVMVAYMCLVRSDPIRRTSENQRSGTMTNIGHFDTNTLPFNVAGKTNSELHEGGDHERFAHYVPKDQLEKAIFEGTPCRALCGKIWTPTRDAMKFPVCPECKEKYEQLEND